MCYRGELGKPICAFHATGRDEGWGRSLWSGQCLSFEWRSMEPNEDCRLRGQFFTFSFLTFQWFEFKIHRTAFISFYSSFVFNDFNSNFILPYKVKSSLLRRWNTNWFWYDGSDERLSSTYVESYFFQTHTKDNISRYATSSSFYLSAGYFSIFTSIYQHFGFINQLLVETFSRNFFFKFVMSFNVLWCWIYFNTCLNWVFCDVKEYYKIIKILMVKFNILMSFVWQIYMTFLNFRTCWNSWKVIKSIEIWALWRDYTDGFVLVLCGTIFRLFFIIENRFFLKKSSWGWKSSVVFWKCCSGPPLCL